MINAVLNILEFPLPDTKTKRHIFKLHTSRMSLADDVELEELVMAKDDLSGADIKAVCSECKSLASAPSLILLS